MNATSAFRTHVMSSSWSRPYIQNVRGVNRQLLPCSFLPRFTASQNLASLSGLPYHRCWHGSYRRLAHDHFGEGRGFGGRSRPCKHPLGLHVVAAGARGASGSSKKSKGKTVFLCDNCGEDFPQWHGKCPACGEWSTLQTFNVPGADAASTGGGGAGNRAITQALDSPTAAAAGRKTRKRGTLVEETSGPQLLSRIGTRSDEARIKLGGNLGKEIGSVLGGGIMPGSLILIGGDPGVGKSTLLMQMCDAVTRGSSPSSTEDDDSGEVTGDEQPGSVLYISGEESVDQVGNRARRLGVDGDGVYLYSATSIDRILVEISQLRPSVVIVDSIQTVYLEDVSSSAGSMTQVRESATALLHCAKRLDVPIFLVGHVTKQGDIAGPRALQHIVDVVVFLEGEGLAGSARLLRGIKNRYGPTDEVAVLQMADQGLAPVVDPSSFFLSSRACSDVGAAITVVMEGSRPILLEIQALCSRRPDQEKGGARNATGVDRNRLQMILAVLAKRGRLAVHQQDVFVNVTGGLDIKEPASDLAIAMTVASSYHEVGLGAGTVFLGELGLGGELRAVPRFERRLQEAAKLGFTHAVLPSVCKGQNGQVLSIPGMQIDTFDNLQQVLKYAFQGKGS